MTISLLLIRSLSRTSRGSLVNKMPQRKWRALLIDSLDRQRLWLLQMRGLAYDAALHWRSTLDYHEQGMHTNLRCVLSLSLSLSLSLWLLTSLLLWTCGTWLVWWPAAATTLLVNICPSVIMLCILSLLASNSGNTAIQHDISQNNKQGSPTNHSSSFVPLHVGIFMRFAATRMYFPFV